MKTPDNKTPDHTPALMGAAEIEALQARSGEYGLPAREACRVLASHAALLAHLDALTGPLPDDGGEALGFALYSALYPQSPESARRHWLTSPPSERARVREGALALYQRGHAAGRSEGEAERLSLHRQIADIHRIADEEQGLRVERDATIARLTADLARLSAENLTRIDAAKRNADAAEEIERRHLQELAAARLDGAREEREACALIAEEEERLLYRQDGEQACARVRRHIRARATEGRQGS